MTLVFARYGWWPGFSYTNAEKQEMQAIDPDGAVIGVFHLVRFGSGVYSSGLRNHGHAGCDWHDCGDRRRRAHEGPLYALILLFSLLPDGFVSVWRVAGGHGAKLRNSWPMVRRLGEPFTRGVNHYSILSQNLVSIRADHHRYVDDCSYDFIYLLVVCSSGLEPRFVTSRYCSDAHSAV